MTTQQESNYLHNVCEGQKKENLNFVRKTLYKTIKLLPHCNKGVVILCSFQLLLYTLESVIQGDSLDFFHSLSTSYGRIHGAWVRIPPKAAHFSDCLGCAVLLCLVVCLTLLASFFLPSHLSLKHVYIYCLALLSVNSLHSVHSERVVR